MPVVFSSARASAAVERVLWVDDYVSRADSGLLTPTTKSFGFKTYIPGSARELLKLDPAEYLAAFRDQLAKPACSERPRSPIKLQGRTKQEAELLIRKALGMADTATMQAPSISITSPDTETTPDCPTPTTRKSAPLHKNLITKLRPMPFQYVWTVHYDKSASSPTTDSSAATAVAAAATYDSRLTTLSSAVPDIAEFYKIFNNIPWSSVKSRDSVHIFRSGVQPLWEDSANLDGGSFTIKVRKHPNDPDRPRRVWEEICLMGCGGELQAALAESGSRDHVLGMSFSPRLYWVHISVWTKKGGEEKSRAVVQKTVLERLSPDLRPTSEGEYYYKRHCEHEGWEEAVGRKKKEEDMT